MRITLTLDTDFGNPHPTNRPTNGEIASAMIKRLGEIKDALVVTMDEKGLRWFQLTGFQVNE